MQEVKTTIKNEGAMAGKAGLFTAISDDTSPFFSTASNRYITALSKSNTHYETENLGNNYVNIHTDDLVFNASIEFQENACKILGRPAFAKALTIFSAADISSDGTAFIQVKEYMRLRKICKSLAWKEMVDAASFLRSCLICYRIEKIPKKELAYYSKQKITAFNYDYSRGRRTILGGIQIIKMVDIGNGGIEIKFGDDYLSLVKVFSGITMCKELLKINDKTHPAAYWIGYHLVVKLNIDTRKYGKTPSHLTLSIKNLLKVAGSGIQAAETFKNRHYRERIVKKLEKELDALACIDCIANWNYSTSDGKRITQEEADKTPFQVWKNLSIDFNFPKEIIEEITQKNAKYIELSNNDTK